MGFTGFYWIFLGLTGFYWVLLDHSSFFRILGSPFCFLFFFLNRISNSITILVFYFFFDFSCSFDLSWKVACGRRPWRIGRATVLFFISVAFIFLMIDFSYRVFLYRVRRGPVASLTSIGRVPRGSCFLFLVSCFFFFKLLLLLFSFFIFFASFCFCSYFELMIHAHAGSKKNRLIRKRRSPFQPSETQ